MRTSPKGHRDRMKSNLLKACSSINLKARFDAEKD